MLRQLVSTNSGRTAGTKQESQQLAVAQSFASSARQTLARSVVHGYLRHQHGHTVGGTGDKSAARVVEFGADRYGEVVAVGQPAVGQVHLAR